MFLIGLTGGIGSGKSTAAQRFGELGCDVLDVDGVAREIVEPGQAALEEIVRRFGPGVLGSDGRLDRPALAARVFVDDDARHDLDRITHPRVAARIAERIQELLQDRTDPAPHLIVVDHPLLIETGQAGRFDAVVVVEVALEERVRRLVEGRRLPEHDVRARIAVQADDATRRAAATHLLDNNGDVSSLHAQVDAVHAELLTQAIARGEGVAGRAG
ncbi:MAG: dephospho-CoA kinase [Nitriliruptoraceae bacterium]